MHIRKSLVLLLTLVLLTSPSIIYADGGSLQLLASDTTLVVGQEITVKVLVEDAPTIYGADVCLVFDPSLLEVIDADENTPGTQLKPGGFIDPEKSFVLQHGADNENGTVDYALALRKAFRNHMFGDNGFAGAGWSRDNYRVALIDVINRLFLKTVILH